MSVEERDNLTKEITAGLHGQKAYTIQVCFLNHRVEESKRMITRSNIGRKVVPSKRTINFYIM